MNNKYFLDFWGDITDPKVDLKFFNDFVRNSIGLGMALAIGFLMIDNAERPIEQFSAWVIPSITILLMFLNMIQLIFVIVKISGFFDNLGLHPVLEWLGIIALALLFLAIFIATVLIFIGNFQIVLQNIRH